MPMKSAAMTSTVVNSNVKKFRRTRNAPYSKFVVECNDDGADKITDDDVVVVLQQASLHVLLRPPSHSTIS